MTQLENWQRFIHEAHRRGYINYDTMLTCLKAAQLVWSEYPPRPRKEQP